jgi:3-oxoacid CoA-transferase subunit B
VTRVITELGVYDISPEGGFKLVEIQPGATIEQILAATSGRLIR